MTQVKKHRAFYEVSHRLEEDVTEVYKFHDLKEAMKKADELNLKESK